MERTERATTGHELREFRFDRSWHEAPAGDDRDCEIDLPAATRLELLIYVNATSDRAYQRRTSDGDDNDDDGDEDGVHRSIANVTRDSAIHPPEGLLA
ncbi:hypothetical protein G5I_09107 [Acromyrmex echinatior]|uniref:Uncharacterized protein n=1 Tax=Acromyrmex echinatior TaxID=103372 RepID=F4WTE9_ACREC|nr:hypothetical protein G5I_09107 [Acromyrmex echinatior]